MTLVELVNLIHAVDRRRGGCSVEVTTINVPPGNGALYGVVRYGAYARTFHDEEELRDVLEKGARP